MKIKMQQEIGELYRLRMPKDNESLLGKKKRTVAEASILK